jgi:hypothetical protein
MANNSINESFYNLQLFEVCTDTMLWNFIIAVACLAIVCLICQVIFTAIVGQEISTGTITLQQVMFIAFHFIFMTSYSTSFLLQQTGECGWLTLGDISCKIITWIRHFSYNTCNCLLLFSWDQRYDSIKYKLFSFRLFIICTIAILGVVTVPYLVFTRERSIHSEWTGNTIHLSYCELSSGYDIAVESIEVICGTVILSSLVLGRIAKDIIYMFKQKDQNNESKENRRYSEPPSPEVIASARDKLNSRRLVQLNVNISLSFLCFVLPQRYFDFILYLDGNLQTIHTLGSKNISGLGDYNWKILMSFLTVLPLFHGVCLLLAHTSTKIHAIKLFRRRAPKPIKRRVPIRQHTDNNSCRSLDDLSDHGSERNSEVDNGSIADK